MEDEEGSKGWFRGLGVGGVLAAVAVVGIAAAGSLIYTQLGNGRANNFRDMSAHYDSEFRDKTVIITGANTGVGFAAAELIAKHGGKVILACRDRARAQEAAERIRHSTGSQHVQTEELDVSNFESIRQFAGRIHSCHILINNAGAVMSSKKELYGMESTIMTNYVGPWYLTRLLLPILAHTSSNDRCEVRIINVGSRSETTCTLGQAFATEGETVFNRMLFDFQQLKNFKPMGQYALSKLGNMLLTYELDRQIRHAINTSPKNLLAHPLFAYAQKKSLSLTDFTPRIVVNAVTPGFTNTNIFRFSGPIIQTISYPLRAAVLKSVDQGGAELVYAASQGGVSGVYFGEHMEVESSAAAKDSQLGHALFAFTEAIVKKQVQS